MDWELINFLPNWLCLQIYKFVILLRLNRRQTFSNAWGHKGIKPVLLSMFDHGSSFFKILLINILWLIARSIVAQSFSTIYSKMLSFVQNFPIMRNEMLICLNLCQFLSFIWYLSRLFLNGAEILSPWEVLHIFASSWTMKYLVIKGIPVRFLSHVEPTKSWLHLCSFWLDFYEISTSICSQWIAL